jgi:RNA polymerase sigma factor (sigma-70 family)
MNGMNSDTELLRGYLNRGSQADFAVLVARRIDFVYACALRQVGGDTHLAEEVTQSVFLDLARKAGSLVRRSSIIGWLYTSARFAAAKALRTRARRLHRETRAHLMEEITAMHSRAEIDWNELRPVIDHAMHELSERDREAILQRYFEGRSFVEVGHAVGLPENSARMRVDRALEKLRARLAERGITSTAVALAAVLANQPAVAAPSGLAAATASASLAGAATSSAAGAILGNFMNMTSYKVGAACLLVCAAGIGLYQMNQARIDAWREAAALADTSNRQAREIAALREENKRLKSASAPGAATTSSRATSGSRFSAEEIRQQVLSAFRTASMAEAFIQIATVFQHIGPANWRGALQGFEDARKQGENAGPAWCLFAQRVGESVGKDGVEHFVAVNDLEAARWALSGWASTSPTAALQWIGKEASAETRGLIVGAAIRGLALSEPDLAVTAMEGIPIDQRKNYVFDFAANLVRGAGMEQAEELVNGIIRRAAANGQAGDDYVKRIFGEYTEIKVRRAAVSGDVSSAADWVKAHVNQPYADVSVIPGTAEQLAQVDGARALSWLDSLLAAGVGADPSVPMGYGTVLQMWAKQEGSATVNRWLASNTNHPRYDYMVAQYAAALAATDASEASRLAGTIKNATRRANAQKAVAQVTAAGPRGK